MFYSFHAQVCRGDRDGGPHCGSTGLLKVLSFEAEISVTQAEFEEAAKFVHVELGPVAQIAVFLQGVSGSHDC